MNTFQPDLVGPSWCEQRPIRKQDESWILAFLDDHQAASVLEIGPGDGSRAAWLLRRLPDLDYRGFEAGHPLTKASLEALSPFAERASVEPRDLALPLPIPDGVFDVALCLDLLEFLRMDQLYMMLSEARRALRPGGLCFLRVLSGSSGLNGRIAAALWRMSARHAPTLVGGSRPLDLNHYISPEDWRILLDSREPTRWLTRQSIVLERV